MNSTQLQIQLGKWIVQERQLAGYSQREFADAISQFCTMHITTMCRIEKGLLWPRADKLAAICKTLNVDCLFQIKATRLIDHRIGKNVAGESVPRFAIVTQ